MKTDKELYEFCKAHYYCIDFTDDGKEEETLWQPFENWCAEEIEENIQHDVEALKKFLADK